jgi:CheY-like chemotaxis protein
VRQIVIIDDSDPDLLYARIVVEQAHIADEVLTFGTAIEALEFLAASPKPVDLILLDINMPEMGGFEFLDRFEMLPAPHRHTAVVVMLTSSPDPQDRARAQTYSVVRAYVVKPLDLDAARGLLQICLTSSSPAAGGTRA